MCGNPEEGEHVWARPAVHAEVNATGVFLRGREHLSAHRDKKDEMRYLEHSNHARLGELQNGLDVARDCMARRNLDFRVEHHHNLLEFGVVDDGEGAMAARTPQRDEITQPRGCVRDARRERFDELHFSRVGRLASLLVAPKVAGRVFVIRAVNELGWVTACDTLISR